MLRRYVNTKLGLVNGAIGTCSVGLEATRQVVANMSFQVDG